MSPHIVIIGNGISGITAARHIRKKSDARVTVISGESEHFFSRTALMYLYMGHMRFEDIKPYEDGFWARNRIDLVNAWVSGVDSDSKHVELQDGSMISYDGLIIASGSRPERIGRPGEDLPGVQGLHSLQDLELMERNTQGISRAAIVGGGLVGLEMAEMLRSRRIDTTILVREASYWGSILPREEGELIGRHMIEHGVDLRLSCELEAVIAGEDGRASAVRTMDGTLIPCQFVGIAVGVRPNIGFLKNGSGIAVDKGILVNEYLETDTSGVFAIGDCAQFSDHPDPQRRAIEQIWYTGRIMGETVARTVTGERTPYRPGTWFNSAKFFDIEYQTYGWVRHVLNSDEAEHYWEHPDKPFAMRIVWERESRVLRGVNALGIRLRHEVMDQWLSSHATVDHVIEHLEKASFDPEFHPRTGAMIRSSFRPAVVDQP